MPCSRLDVDDELAGTQRFRLADPSSRAMQPIWYCGQARAIRTLRPGFAYVSRVQAAPRTPLRQSGQTVRSADAGCLGGKHTRYHICTWRHTNPRSLSLIKPTASPTLLPLRDFLACLLNGNNPLLLSTCIRRKRKNHTDTVAPPILTRENFLRTTGAVAHCPGPTTCWDYGTGGQPKAGCSRHPGS